jgi:hypothetical protein
MISPFYYNDNCIRVIEQATKHFIHLLGSIAYGSVCLFLDQLLLGIM